MQEYIKPQESLSWEAKKQRVIVYIQGELARERVAFAALGDRSRHEDVEASSAKVSRLKGHLRTIMRTNERDDTSHTNLVNDYWDNQVSKSSNK